MNGAEQESFTHSFISLIRSLITPSFSTWWQLLAADCLFQTQLRFSIYPTHMPFLQGDCYFFHQEVGTYVYSP